MDSGIINYFNAGSSYWFYSAEILCVHCRHERLHTTFVPHLLFDEWYGASCVTNIPSFEHLSMFCFTAEIWLAASLCFSLLNFLDFRLRGGSSGGWSSVVCLNYFTIFLFPLVSFRLAPDMLNIFSSTSFGQALGFFSIVLDSIWCHDWRRRSRLTSLGVVPGGSFCL